MTLIERRQFIGEPKVEHAGETRLNADRVDGKFKAKVRADLLGDIFPGARYIVRRQQVRFAQQQDRPYCRVIEGLERR